ncbi:MAG: hypothetical protein DMG30_16830 [Acidobacteria bacterium]|nr:MAG: hypothetical protein DMG30_16830 [Acidobacteriota bacterium]
MWKPEKRGLANLNKLGTPQVFYPLTPTIQQIFRLLRMNLRSVLGVNLRGLLSVKLAQLQREFWAARSARRRLRWWSKATGRMGCGAPGM